MNIYKKIKNQLFLLLSIGGIAFINQSKMQAGQDCQFNIMIDCAYPMSGMQEIRQNLNQSLYSLQQNNYSLALDLLEDSVSKMNVRQVVSQDDRDYIQAMINQIDALIAQLEQGQDQSRMIELADHIKSLL